MNNKIELYRIEARMRYIEKNDEYEVTIEEKNVKEKINEQIIVETEEEGLQIIRKGISKMQIYNELMKKEGEK